MHQWLDQFEVEWVSRFALWTQQRKGVKRTPRVTTPYYRRLFFGNADFGDQLLAGLFAVAPYEAYAHR